MDKNQSYFDPYNFNMQAQQQNMAMQTPDAIGACIDNVTPAMYYEQQYMYYRYLTQMLEYKIKLKDFEKMNKDSK